MRKSRFTEEQIRYVVQQAELGIPVPELCRRYEGSAATFYRWRQRYGALTKHELARLKDLERDNSRLKKIVAELTLDKQILQDVLSRRYRGLSAGASTWLASSIATSSASGRRVGPWGGRGAVSGT